MKLFYRKIGKGEPLVIAHGLYGMSDNWMSIAKTLSENFEVIVPDLRNHGQSPWADSHTYSDLAGDLLELLNDLSIEKANFLGHSMGGKVVMKLALENPGNIKKLIVADVSPRNYIDFEEKSGFNHSDVLKLLQNIDLRNIKLRTEAENVLSYKVSDKRIRQFLMKNISREKNGTFAFKLNAVALFNNLNEIAGEINLANGKIFNGDVLFIKGDKSNYIRESDRSQILELFPSARFVTVKNAGHWLHAEQPEVFAGVVRNFLLSKY